jgi:trimeric autotransporter adhesin
LPIVLALVSAGVALAQTYIISTVAGGGVPVNIPGTSASLGSVGPLATDSHGSLFLGAGNMVLRWDPSTGILTAMAGNGQQGYSGDGGNATSAQLSPISLAVDAAGNLYIADYMHYCVREVSGGVIRTVAGTGISGGSGDNGPAAAAQLTFPTGVALDASGNLYIADGQRVRMVSNGIITTVACGGFSAADNVPATSAQLLPQGIAADGQGTLYIADFSNRVRKVSGGVITTVAGNGTSGYSGDNGPATAAQLSDPSRIAVDSLGDLFILDLNNDVIRRVSNGIITTVVGNGTVGWSGDNGPALKAQLHYPTGIALDPANNLYIADSGNNRIRRVSVGIIDTIAGGGASLGDGGPATSAQLNWPHGVAVDSDGGLLISDWLNNRIRKVSNGMMTTLAGTGPTGYPGGYSGDNGPATSARLNLPAGITVDAGGDLYLADFGNNVVRRVSGGMISTMAGDGAWEFSGDNGPALSAGINPWSEVRDAAGNLYIADWENNRIRRVSNGVIDTIAGTGIAGYSGDGGDATSAQLAAPQGVALDAAGELYIADSGNSCIRKVSGGVITTVAGNGTQGFTGDNGPATNAQLLNAQAIALDSRGNLYIADTDRIRVVSNGFITTVAGNGTQGFSGDGGSAMEAQLSFPTALTVDSASNIYFADSTNDRVRVLTPSGFSLLPSSMVVWAQASTGRITVGAPREDAAWTASSNASWLTVTSGGAGVGSGTVDYSVAANRSAKPRTGALSIAGLIFSITQAADERKGPRR